MAALVCVFGFFVFATLASAQFTPFAPSMVNVSEYVPLRSYQNSTLYQMKLSNSSYVYDPYLIDLYGSRYDHGYAYAYLLADEIKANYEALMHNILGDKWYSDVLIDLVAELCDWQWNDYLSAELPGNYQDELLGIQAGGQARGYGDDVLKYSTRCLVLANMPGDIQDFIFVLIREWKGDTFADNLGLPHGSRKFNGFCSMMAAWGDRTENGLLFSFRNLDWQSNTGINKYKLAIVYHPPDAISHTTLGFAGVWGALTGMSAAGITVHEANLEENEITFSGFPWLLRLRYIMEYAQNTSQAAALWSATNNTVGFNFGVFSNNDAISYSQGRAVGPGVGIVMETMFNYTATFTDDDPREANATYTNGNDTVQIGFPMKEAVYRTNHPYDPVTRAHFEWSQSPSSWSMQRYMFIYDGLEYYQSIGQKLDLYHTANLSAIAGDKGNHPYYCADDTDGSNILSVAYSPSQMMLAAAWERNSGDNWRPAACSDYVMINMAEWF